MSLAVRDCEDCRDDKQSLGDDSLVYLNRVPAQLFSPPLARLQKYIENLENMDVSLATMNHASRLLASFVRFHEDQDAREDHILDDINTLLNGSMWQKPLAGAPELRPSASWFFQSYAIGLLELKNTLGIGGDAMYQVLADYVKLIAAEEVCIFLIQC